MIITIKHTAFNADAYEGYPVVHTDDRRDITERVEDGQCTTCILVKPGANPLGHHYHTLDEPFLGRGRGKLYVVPEGGDLSKPEVYDLPADGWEVTVPAGVAHAFTFDGEPDDKGRIAVLVSTKDWEFNEKAAKGVVNTYRVQIVIPAAA